MRRADRLFQIVQQLRGGRLVTAKILAERLEVSERTIYRDIADLQSTGVPIDGEAGIGYIMREGFDLPPLMFTRDEIVALVTGARMVRAWGGATMARAAEEALIKISSVLPETERNRISRVAVHAPVFQMTSQDRENIDRLEGAVEKKQVVRFNYQDAKAKASSRDAEPLGLWFWGGIWTLVAWCQLRQDFRVFRVDRIIDLTLTTELYRPQKGKTLRDFYLQQEQHGNVPEGYDLELETPRN